jgi:peptidoglycan/LPS O-acetylase OafA/YrhL
LILIPLRHEVPVFSFLGTISYSLSLVHIPLGARILIPGELLPHTTIIQLTLLLTAIAFALGGAYCTWGLIEQPTLTLSKTIVMRTSTKPLGSSS